MAPSLRQPPVYTNTHSQLFSAFSIAGFDWAEISSETLINYYFEI